MPTSTITARAFDLSQDLLWAGDSKGRLGGYYFDPTSGGLGRYTSFGTQSSPIVSILTNDRGVITAGKDQVSLHSRRGILRKRIADPAIKGVSAMAFSTKGTSEVLVGGAHKQLARINLDRGTLSASREGRDRNSSYTCMKRGSLTVACGSSTGAIDIVDPNSLQTVKTFAAHSGPVSDIDCRGYTVMTCGFSPRKNGFLPDLLVNLFDLRAMKPLAPVPFPSGASFVRLHPKLSTCCMIASTNGQVQSLDYVNPPNGFLYQSAISSALTGLDLSPSGDYMVLTDSEGFLQLWANSTGPSSGTGFSEFPVPLELPTAGADSAIVIDAPYFDSTPLSAVGMPYYKEELLSSWSDPNFVFNTGMPAPAIDADIVAALKPGEVGSFAPYKKRRPRNIAQKYVSFDQHRRSSASIPKFISEKERTGETEDPDAIFADDVPLDPNKIPRAYRKLEIKYSKFGIADFDFDFYNRTQYSGLETQLANSYTNPLLQLLRFSPLFYNACLEYVARYNTVDNISLLNELGLLFDMLHKANGKHCRASNFLKTLSLTPQASKLGLIHDDITGSQPASSAHLLQSFCRFLLDCIALDESSIASTNFFDSVTGIVVNTTRKSLTCGAESVSTDVFRNLELVSLVSSSSQQKYFRASSYFLDSLQRSLESWTQMRGWCEACQKYQLMGTLQSVQKFPPLLNVSIPLEDGTAHLNRQYWASDSWPAKEFVVTTVRGKLTVRRQGNGDKYRLLGLIAQIAGQDTRGTHLVCLVRIDEQWYLFNDFLVKSVSEKEALDFSVPWKTPVLLIYQSAAAEQVQFDYDGFRAHMDTSILYRDHFATGLRESAKREYELLCDSEAPEPGSLVAMDAEFVMLQQEETEIRSDGTKSLLRPTLLSLARVSCLRGQGPKRGVAFIDDYILTTETIVDYLTEFSGIEPGDLDPAVSSHNLVTLQASYKKLWLLLNLGCVFLGHGLYNDFRTINIRVPENQVIDTVDIYYLKSRQRKLSLKFLAWFFLGEAVQTGNHDSIEDAHTALSLYYKFQELRQAGTFSAQLEECYNEGRKWNFKPPPQDKR